MANFINWLKTSQISKSGSPLQMQGNPASSDESPASGVASGLAPAGANYAMVWAAAETKVKVDILKDEKGQDVTSAFEIAIPANTLLEIPNIIAGRSKITMTDV